MRHYVQNSRRALRSRTPGTRIAVAALGLLATAALAGCGSALGKAGGPVPALSITPGISSLDTNCTGCNAMGAHGAAVEQFAALTPDGDAAEVTWSVSSGDKVAGPGSIDAEGRYTPPGYLTADADEVFVTARLKANPAVRASARVTISPGFLQPLTPENAAVGSDGSLTLSGRLAEAGGSAGIRFALASSPMPRQIQPTPCWERWDRLCAIGDRRPLPPARSLTRLQPPFQPPVSFTSLPLRATLAPNRPCFSTPPA